METFESWTKTLYDGYDVDVVYLDYRKAFDTAPHASTQVATFGIDSPLLLGLDQEFPTLQIHESL